jgi:cytochrome oxidase assembly protein ShyY1
MIMLVGVVLAVAAIALARWQLGRRGAPAGPRTAARIRDRRHPPTSRT